MRAAIVFDMDGVLADTERLKFRAHRAACEAMGGGLDADTYRREMGGVHEEVVRAFLAASELETTHDAVEDYETRFQDAYRRLLTSDFRAMPGAREVLAACRTQERPLALVTSSEGWMAGTVLDRLGARDAFRAVVTADDVRNEKPHPEPYRRARRALAASGRAAVAVEDTRAGVASAAAAGLPVLVVRHDFNRDQAFDEAAAVLESLAPAEAFLETADEVVEGWTRSDPPSPRTS